MAAPKVLARTDYRLMRSALQVALVRRLTLPAVMLLTTSDLHAQSPLIARADSAFAAEDRSLARRLYQEALRVNPEHSRAIFRLAQLEPAQERALELFTRYVALEPGDAWGHMALGDHLAHMGRVDAALLAYEKARVLEPNERDVVIGRARILSGVGRLPEAQQTLSEWALAHGDDGEVWDMLGREQLRAGRPRAAAQSFTRAQAAGFGRGVQGRLQAAHSQRAPAFEPIVGYQHDSDGNSTLRSGLSAHIMIGDGARLGAGFQRGSVRDATESSIPFIEVALRLAARPAAGMRLSAEAGINNFEITAPPASPAPAPPGTGPPGSGPPGSGPPGSGPPGVAPQTSVSWTEPRTDVRLRVRALPNGPALELRAQHQALGSAPMLIANRVTRSDMRATLELPLGPVKLRGITRAGVVRAREEPANRRLDGAAVLVAPLGTAAELSARYQAVTYARQSSAGYFAPRIAETIEGGTYMELGADRPIALSVDLGAGLQRTALQAEDVGRWKPAFRAWTYSSLSLGPGRALWLEIEAYDAPFAPLGVSAAPAWRYVSLTSGLRWAMR